MQPPHLLPALSSGFSLIVQAHPRRQPHMRFLSVGSRFCLQLPSAPGQRPCPWLTIQAFSAQAVPVVDFHHQIDAHAGQTKNGTTLLEQSHRHGSGNRLTRRLR